MTRVDSSPQRSASQRIARVITEVFAPVVLTVGLLLVVGASSTENPLVGLGWGLLAALFVGVFPYAFLLLGVRRGRWSDRHVRIREQRRVPMIFAALSACTGVALLLLLDAPSSVSASAVAGLAGLVIATFITTWWKMSVHTAVAGGTAAILALSIEAHPVVLASAAMAVGWSRVALGEHTLMQAVVGGLIGAVVATCTFGLLR